MVRPRFTHVTASERLIHQRILLKLVTLTTITFRIYFSSDGYCTTMPVHLLVLMMMMLKVVVVVMMMMLDGWVGVVF